MFTDALLPDRRVMTFTEYVLPDGRTVRVDATAAKGLSVIDFTLVGGRIVNAIRADLVFVCPRCKSLSHNRNDIRERYCGSCHCFTADPA
jgi:hypothetical protein